MVRILCSICMLSCTVCYQESCSLEVECQEGGKIHVKLNTHLELIANKYPEGNVKRTLKRKLKVFEIAEMQAKELQTVEQDCCMAFEHVAVNNYSCCCSKLCAMLLVLQIKNIILIIDMDEHKGFHKWG